MPARGGARLGRDADAEARQLRERCRHATMRGTLAALDGKARRTARRGARPAAGRRAHGSPRDRRRQPHAVATRPGAQAARPAARQAGRGKPARGRGASRRGRARGAAADADPRARARQAARGRRRPGRPAARRRVAAHHAPRRRARSDRGALLRRSRRSQPRPVGAVAGAPARSAPAASWRSRARASRSHAGRRDRAARRAPSPPRSPPRGAPQPWALDVWVPDSDEGNPLAQRAAALAADAARRTRGRGREQRVADARAALAENGLYAQVCLLPPGDRVAVGVLPARDAPSAWRRAAACACTSPKPRRRAPP